MLIRPYVEDASFIIILNVFSQSCRKLSLGKGPMSLLLVVLVFCHTLPPCGHYQELYKKEVNETFESLLDVCQTHTYTHSEKQNYSMKERES